MSIPSLQALRVLEAALRHESFSKAASELSLTHGAISRQITLLEQRLGTVLFVRSQGKMRPTESARVLVTQTRQALAILNVAFGVSRVPVPGLRLSTTQAIARFWLMPRMESLNREHPGILRAISTSNVAVTDWQETTDIAIRYGPGKWPGTHSTLLGHEVQFPVAHKSLLKRYPQWQEAPLIRTPYQSWRAWFDASKLPTPAGIDDYIEVADTALAVDLALAGQGVALARARLVKSFLQSGALVRIGSSEVRDQSSYYLVSAGAEKHLRMSAFKQWLLAAFAEA
jgi:LysR family transcriptional regulator, glycine cleavage system transcriptional activator